MTEAQALARIMEIIGADLPDAETRVEIGMVLNTLGFDRWSQGHDDGRAQGHEEAGYEGGELG